MIRSAVLEPARRDRARPGAAAAAISLTLGLAFGLGLGPALGPERSLAAEDAIRGDCRGEPARRSLREGMRLQGELETEPAEAAYRKCLEAEPGCVACRYELGWSLWKLGRWEDVIATWEKTLELDPSHEKARQFLATARENLALVRAKKLPPAFRSQTEIGVRSTPEGGPVSLMLLARRQSYNPKPASPLDQYDGEIHSPKSVRFSLDGKLVYVNSLEAGRTVVYDALGLTKVGSIRHRFDARSAPLFAGERVFDYRFPARVRKPNEFLGKPVELELTHGGRYLWAPYYRRSFDANGTLPSAMAVIDTHTREIARVLGTGPISKYVRVSPRGRWLAVSHWGDNTVGLYDIRGDEPAAFKPAYLLTVGQRMTNARFKGDRDKDCGFCVRGLAFSPDERYLFVSRMKGGGIAAFELREGGAPAYLGTAFGIVPGPRDLEMSADGRLLYVSCNASGYLAQVPVDRLLAALRTIPPGTPARARETHVEPARIGARLAYVGLGARSVRLSPDERFIFVAVNVTSELVAVSTAAMKVEARIPVDSYPVGLDLSPDGRQAWVTSQGRDAKGGNSIGIYQVRYRNLEVIRGAGTRTPAEKPVEGPAPAPAAAVTPEASGSR